MIRTISLLALLAAARGAFEAAYEAGQDAFNLGKYDEAWAHFLKARELAPDKPGPYRWLGRTARVRENWRECLAYALDALRMHAASKQAPEVRKDVAACRAGLGRPAFAGTLHRGQGALAVIADVDGASVTVDGIAKGRTPMDPVPLVVGRHTLRVEMKGVAPRELPVDILEGVVIDVEVALRPPN
ncbi:MAG TPA: PEGA domain-containing protein [Haliangiales bacterium]|nr:PEGA domain-containing protein [Haliangiales bacterium]